MKSRSNSPTDHLIAASEVARHMFCARALGFDRLHPEDKDGMLLAWISRSLQTPWKVGVLGIFVLVLLLIFGPLETLLALSIAAVLFTAMYFLWRRARQGSNVIVFQDVKAKRLSRSLVASEFGLTGKPDYLLQMEEGEIPVLVKRIPAPEVPHEAHVTQVVAYCLLVAENRGSYPPYGIIRYQDGRTFEVDFDEDSVEVLSQIMDEIESNRRWGDELPGRSHDDRQRCYACRHRKRCDQSLF